jgi:uncharacterized RDD family membrane protein YckC
MTPPDEQTPLEPLDAVRPPEEATAAEAADAEDGAAAAGGSPPLPGPAQQPPAPPAPAYQPVTEPLGHRPPGQPPGQAASAPAGEPLAQPGAYAWQDYIGVGKRFLAVFIDVIIISVVLGFVLAAAGVSSSVQSPSSKTYLMILAVMVAYHTLMEGGTGATVGKMVLGIKVTMEDGSPVTWGAALVRNLLRVVDMIFSYLVGAILVWNSPKRQRLGDRVGRTVVVRSR